MKTKKILLNFITDVVPLIIISLLGIYKSKLFIKVLGDEVLGLYQLFSQVMVYVALVDGGLVNAVLFSLYKPNAEGDEKKVNALLAGAYRCFKLIGIAVFSISAVISLFVPLLIKDYSFNYWYIVLTFMLFALSSVIGYFFVPFNCLLEVKEKKYLYNLTNQVGQIILSVCEIVMLLSNIKFEYILLMHSIVRLLAYLVEAYICKKEFPNINLYSEEKDYSFKRHINSLIFHKINGLIGSNIDTLIISSLMGLKSVAIYTTYNYIVNMLKTILGKLEYSMTAIVGNALASGKSKTYELYKEFNSMLFFIAIVVCVPLTLAINSFIDIWYEGKIMTSTLLAISFSVNLFIYIVKMDTTLFVSAGGLYEETKQCALTDTIVNLVLSLILVNYLGIAGVLIATAISVFVSEYTYKTIVVFQKIFKVSYLSYFINNIKYFILSVVDLMMAYKIVEIVEISSIINWLLFFIVFTIVNAVIILVVFYLFKEVKFMQRLKMLFVKKSD